MTAVSLCLPEPMAARLAHLAQQTGRSKSFYMLQAISAHLDDLEDLYLAEQRLIAHRASGESTVSLAQLTRNYGLQPTLNLTVLSKCHKPKIKVHCSRRDA